MKEVKTTVQSQSQNLEIKSRRKFDAAFKRDAVALWLDSGKPAREIAADLGVEERHIYEWKKTHGPHTPETQSQMESELAALRRENAHLRQRCDILKKTLGILSEPQSSASNGLTP
jgi:transposase